MCRIELPGKEAFMIRRLVLSSIISLFAWGCSGNALPPAPSAAGGAASADAALAPTPATGPAVSKSTVAATAPPPSAASPLRDLTARYLDSDGQGGWRTNEQAATELEKLGPQEAAALWPLLKDPQVEVRRGAAVFLLSQFDPANGEQVAAFTALLGDSDRMVRARALDAAKQFSKEDQIASLPRLAAMLDAAREERADNRAAIARLCGALKGDAAAALPELERAAADDPDARVRAATLVAISQIAEPPQAVPLLAKGLADKEASVRLVAAARLRQLGPAASGAANPLAAALADSGADVAEAAAEALARIGGPAVEPAAGQLSSTSAQARRLGLACLLKIGRPVPSSSVKIEKLKQDPDPQVRQLAEAASQRLTGKQPSR
jgi:hypothetical protein